MARQKGTKLIYCPNCDERIVVMPGRQKTCTHCDHKFKVTKKLIEELACTNFEEVE